MEEKKKMRMVVEEVKSGESKKTEIVDKAEDNPTFKENIEYSPEIKEEIKPDTVKEETEPEKEEKTNKESSFNVLWILIPGMLLLGLLIGGIFAYVFGIQKIADTNKTDSSQTQEVIAEPSISPTLKPTASPSASLSQYKIKILNGSGIKGEAGKVQTLIETAGFSVLSTGNALTYDYTKTEITVKTGIDRDFIIALEKTLKKDYQLEATKTVSSQTNDITVIVGNLKAD